MSAFPLLPLFRQLRAHGLPLGIDDYLAVLRAWQHGFGLEDRAALLDLCLTVWSKSEEDLRLIELLFNTLFPSSASARPARSAATAEPEPAEPVPDMPTSDREGAAAAAADEPDEIISQIMEQEPAQHDLLSSATFQVAATPDVGEPQQIVQAVRQASRPDDIFADDLGESPFALLGDYFPVTRRQMKQSWRYLRRPVREGPPEELDLAATIAKIGREGILYEPVLVPRRRNRARLLLLVDQNGSMTPFHSLTRQLVDTATHGGRLAHTAVYYFHDYVAQNLFTDPAQLAARPTAEVVAQLHERTMVMIVSDGGAARGRYDQHRLDQTTAFIADLGHAVRRLVWLNPLPVARWPGNTAGAIAQHIPMFPMSRAGHDAAINVLRGYRPPAKPATLAEPAASEVAR